MMLMVFNDELVAKKRAQTDAWKFLWKIRRNKQIYEKKLLDFF